MKHLFASLLTTVCFSAYAQFPSLPYNPDENGDMLIGVVDLQALLANYGQEFSSAVVSEDGESAIVYMGDLGYLECEYSCNQLPGFWTLPSAADLVPVIPELNAGEAQAWIDKRDFDGYAWDHFPYYKGSSTTSLIGINQTYYMAYPKKCYCAAKQLPRVEYTVSARTDFETFKNECSSFVGDGWIPLPGGSIREGSNFFSQAFWRLAE